MWSSVIYAVLVGGQMGMARSAVWSRFLSLRHTKITLTNTENNSGASLYIYMGDGLLTQDMSNPRLSPPADLRR